MTPQTSTDQSVHVQAEHIGGIDETSVSFSSGVTILTGRNATNRTSFLQAIMAAMGSDQASLKGNAETGSVELTLGDGTYTRTLVRNNGTVTMDGDPYLDDPAIADLFAFLLEENEARRAVARDDDLRELIMRPVDTDEIQAEIDRLEREKRRLDQQLDELESLERELPELESERTDLEAQIETRREELEAKRAELEEADTSVAESREEQEELEETLEELKNARSELDNVQFQLETERESLDALTEERQELEAAREELPDSVAETVSGIDSKIDRVREEQRKIDSTLNELQTVIEFNEEMLEGTSPEVLKALSDEDNGDTLTEQLFEDDDTVACWTCGSTVPQSDIEATLDELRALREEKASERERTSQRLDELREERSAVEQKQNEREQVIQRLEEIEREFDQRESSIEELETREKSLEQQIESLEGLVEDLEGDLQSDVLEHHREANQLEFELDRLKQDLEDVESEITSVESKLAEREELAAQRETVTSELADQRTRIDQIEQEAVEQFNHHMAEVLALLEYANLERIWIERTEREIRDGRRKTTKRRFDLHIVRSTDDGVSYEDTIDHLSESEREVTGLIFALAGYLVHDVHEIVPVVLLDSLEALDSERLAALVDYLQDYTEYLIVALLLEDAAALDDRYERVTEV
jgi:DNA repair exonuclease SbcCD ATPase subunit